MPLLFVAPIVIAAVAAGGVIGAPAAAIAVAETDRKDAVSLYPVQRLQYDVNVCFASTFLQPKTCLCNILTTVRSWEEKYAAKQFEQPLARGCNCNDVNMRLQ